MLEDLAPDTQALLKVTSLGKSQIADVEQHILFHRDKTGENPSTVRVQEIIEAVKIHATIKGESGNNAQFYKDPNDPSDATKFLDDDTGLAKHAAHLSKRYVQLMEQQGILVDRTSCERTKQASGFLSNRSDKITQLNTQISRSIEFNQDCQQREMDRGRGFSM